MRFHTAYGLDVTQLDIVIVDDNKHAIAITETVLKAFRVQRVRSFTQSLDAFAAMDVDRPNLLILGWLRAPQNTNRFIRSIRHVDSAPLCFLPIMLLSPPLPPRRDEQALSAGANTIMTHPISPTGFFERLGELTRDRRRLIRFGDYYKLEELNVIAPKAHTA